MTTVSTLVVPLWPDAAEALGMSRSSAYRLAAAGEFPVPVIRCGKRLRVSRAALESMLGVPIGEENAA